MQASLGAPLLGQHAAQSAQSSLSAVAVGQSVRSSLNPDGSINLGDAPSSFIVLIAATGAVGLILAFLVPCVSWRWIRAKLFDLAEEQDGATTDAGINWGLIQSHRTYDMARSTIMDAHYAVRRAVRRFLRITSTVALGVGVVCAFALGLVYAFALRPESKDTDVYWPVAVAMPAGFVFAFAVTSAACVGATFQALDAVAAMSLLVGARPSVELAPVLLAAENVSLRASISTASALCGTVIASASGAVALAVWLYNTDGPRALDGRTYNLLTPNVMLSLAAFTTAGHHVACAIYAHCAVAIHHAVDDAIDLSDRAGRHAMSHGLLAAAIAGTAFSVPAAVSTVVFDSLVAFGVSWGAESWDALMLPITIVAAGTVIAISVNLIVPLFAPCLDVGNSDTIPRRSRSTLWLTTALSVAAAFGLTELVDDSRTMFAFLGAGAAVTVVTVETAQFLARGPMVRWVCRASLSASTSAALTSVDSVTLVPALLVATLTLGIIPTYAFNTHGLRALSGMGIGASFPALALAACHGVGSLTNELSTVARMVPFTTEQQAAVDMLRPPRDQASTASAVGSTTAGILVTSVLLLTVSASNPTLGAQWACMAAGAMTDSLVSCVASIAAVGAQARMAPREEYGYMMASVVPRSSVGRPATATDRPPHVMLEVFRNNVWWCALLAPVAVLLSVLGVCVVGFVAGLGYLISFIAGFGIVAQTSALRSALTAGTMRSLHASAERGKLGVIEDATISATADAIHARKVMKQAVLATMCASAAIVTAVAFAPHFPAS